VSTVSTMINILNFGTVLGDFGVDTYVDTGWIY